MIKKIWKIMTDEQIKKVISTGIDALKPVAIGVSHSMIELTLNAYREGFMDCLMHSKEMLWHEPTEEPQEMKEILFQWDGRGTTWHEVGFYHADTKAFSNMLGNPIELKDVNRWMYTCELMPEKKEESNNN